MLKQTPSYLQPSLIAHYIKVQKFPRATGERTGGAEFVREEALGAKG